MPLKYLSELKKLNLLTERYAIFGSGPLAIRNLRKNKDIDLAVSKDLWFKLVKKYPQGVNDPKIKIQLSKNISAYDINCLVFKIDLKKDVEFIKGLPFITLQKTLEWKKLKNREKDQDDIKLIENYLK